MAEAALWLQRLHQLFERQVLMGLGIQCMLLDLLQQLFDPQLRAELGFHDLRVDEEADQPLGLDAVAVGDGHADTDIVLAAVAVQKSLERCQQQHERRDAEARGQLLHRVAQARRQGERQVGATVALFRRAWAIRRQLQYAVFSGQLSCPVGQLALTLAGVHPLALPGGIVGILDGQVGQADVLLPT
ncbi:hypothetical protein PFLU3_56940 [Pseudomonas fluorescens]|uniref:Uncharacterized protein n=1 Tax=Pseudomonas fluorescens TaxID=294 RepID=A0A0D0SPS3_PSEFL|nr:hypothetical protein PFLU3_56940 [Pseudomonas fluorescens]